jgi:hypothetical protein
LIIARKLARVVEMATIRATGAPIRATGAPIGQSEPVVAGHVHVGTSSFSTIVQGVAHADTSA